MPQGPNPSLEAQIEASRPRAPEAQIEKFEKTEKIEKTEKTENLSPKTQIEAWKPKLKPKDLNFTQSCGQNPCLKAQIQA